MCAPPNCGPDHPPAEADAPPTVHDRIDLEQSIIDAVALELPMSPLCSEDCPGLCQVCGIRLAVAEPGHAHELIDPRWAGLANKFSELSDGETDAEPDTQERRD